MYNLPHELPTDPPDLEPWPLTCPECGLASTTDELTEGDTCPDCDVAELVADEPYHPDDEY